MHFSNLPHPKPVIHVSELGTRIVGTSHAYELRRFLSTDSDLYELDVKRNFLVQLFPFQPWNKIPADHWEVLR